MRESSTLACYPFATDTRVASVVKSGVVWYPTRCLFQVKAILSAKSILYLHFCKRFHSCHLCMLVGIEPLTKHVGTDVEGMESRV